MASFMNAPSKTALMVLSFAMASCTATSPVRQNVAVVAPAGWVAGAGSSEDVDDRWWNSLNDSKLSALVDEAINNNHDLKAAAGRLQTATAESRIAHADLYPQVSAGLDGSRSRSNLSGLAFGSALGGGGSDGGVASFFSNSFGAALNSSWEIDLWGRVRKGASASIADLEASEADYAARGLSLAAQTSKLWFALTEARLQLELAETTAKTYRDTAQQAGARVEEGIQSPTDQKLAISNRASAEALVEQRRETIQRVSRQLEALIGRYPKGQLAGASKLPNLSPPPSRGLPAEMIRRRPDLIAAERRVAAADKRIAAAKAALYPKLSLTGSGGTSSNLFEELLNGDFYVWSIAGNAMQPIFQGGRLRAQVDVSKGRFKDAVESFAQSALTAYSEVEAALSVDAVLGRREAKLREAADAASEAAEIALNRYDQGVETFLVVLESQRRTLDSQSALISARRARLDNRVDLHLALGGGFHFPPASNE